MRPARYNPKKPNENILMRLMPAAVQIFVNFNTSVSPLPPEELSSLVVQETKAVLNRSEKTAKAICALFITVVFCVKLSDGTKNAFVLFSQKSMPPKQEQRRLNEGIMGTRSIGQVPQFI